MKLNECLILIAAILITAVLTHLLWKDTPHGSIPLRIDTVFVPYAIHDTLPGKIRLIKLNTPINIDSLWHEALTYAENEIKKSNPPDSAETNILNNYRFISQADTAYQDSMLTLRLKFNSPIPLHPASYFSYNILYKEKQIQQYLPPPAVSFWNRFHYSINCGLGYGLINKNFDFYVGLGGCFNF